MDPVSTPPSSDPHAGPKGCGDEDCSDCWWHYIPVSPVEKPLHLHTRERTWLGWYVTRLARAAELIAQGHTTAHPVETRVVVDLLEEPSCAGILNQVVAQLREHLRTQASNAAFLRAYVDRWYVREEQAQAHAPALPPMMRWAVAVAPGNASTKAVLLVLAAHANRTGLVSPGPSYSDLCRMTCLSRSTVAAALRALDTGGYLEKIHAQRLNGPHASNSYQLLVPDSFRHGLSLTALRPAEERIR